MTFKLSHAGPQLIIADGINGCGKTSFIDALQDRLDQEGIRSQKLSMLSGPVRDLVLGNHPFSHRQLAMLLKIASLDVGQEARRLMSDGSWVLMDRGPASYFAYQGRAANEQRFIAGLDQLLATPFPAANFAVFLDVPYEVAFARLQLRHSLHKQDDRFEDIGQDFEMAAQAGFREYFENISNSSLSKVIQITDDIPTGFLCDLVFEDIYQQLKSNWDNYHKET